FVLAARLPALVALPLHDALPIELRAGDGQARLAAGCWAGDDGDEGGRWRGGLVGHGEGVAIGRRRAAIGNGQLAIGFAFGDGLRSEEHTSALQSRANPVWRRPLD